MRYTMEDLGIMTDKELVLSVLNERKDKCKNYYSPLCRRLKQTIYRLEKEDFGEY